MSQEYDKKLDSIRRVATREVVSNLYNYLAIRRKGELSDHLKQFKRNLSRKLRSVKDVLSKSSIETHIIVFTELCVHLHGKSTSAAIRILKSKLDNNKRKRVRFSSKLSKSNKKRRKRSDRTDSEDDDDDEDYVPDSDEEAEADEEIEANKAVVINSDDESDDNDDEDDDDVDDDDNDDDEVVSIEEEDGDVLSNDADKDDSSNEDISLGTDDSDEDYETDSEDSVDSPARHLRKFAKSYIKKINGDKELREYIKLRSISGGSIEPEDIKYFKTLSKPEKEQLLKMIKSLREENLSKKPMVFQVIDSKMPTNSKAYVMRKAEILEQMDPSSSEYYKLSQWIEALLKINFGSYAKDKMTTSKGSSNIKSALRSAELTMNNKVYGHPEAKNRILQICAQRASNPNALGDIIGIEGPMGNGKTTLVKEGICRALGRPLAFISLGGATDSSWLDGHSYTYEGARCGQIVTELSKTGVMNPVFLFDELDKISQTEKGQEVSNVLMHLTDQTQNTMFKDKYFEGIDFDMSKAILIFTFNDRSLIDPILRDRMTIMKTNAFRVRDKIPISQEYLMPAILKDVGVTEDAIVIPDEIIAFLVNTYTHEGGVRKLKELLYEIAREINLRKKSGKRLLDKTVQYPLTITKDILRKDLFLHKIKISPQRIHTKPTVGLMNGMYASVGGDGGIIPIECSFMPSDSSSGIQLKTTGNLGKVIQESMEVAKTIAWERLTRSEQIKHRSAGLHIHTPDAGVEKDGPSAGAAVTVAVISRLKNLPVKNDIAMTGEIDLNGNITEIGGLRDKLEGSKNAGVKLALYPVQNQSHIDQIKMKDPDLIDDTFEVKAVSHIDEVLDLVFE